MKLIMVVPSKTNLLKFAQPIERLRLNRNVCTLVVDRATKTLFEKAVAARRIPFCETVKFEFTDHPSGVLIALDGAGQFCGSYSLPGTAQTEPRTNGGEVRVQLSEVAFAAICILASAWFVAHSIASSISQ